VTFEEARHAWSFWKGDRMQIELLVAVGLIVVAFLIGRAVGSRNGLIKNWIQEIQGDMQDIEKIIKYHCESLPLVAKDLMDDYAENKKFHEQDGTDMMMAVGFHYSRINSCLLDLNLKSYSKDKEIAQAIDKWWPSIVAKAENAEAAFVQQICSTVDPEFRKNVIKVNEKSFDWFYKICVSYENYWERSALYHAENPHMR
jgi:hypothetical protein